MLHTSDTRGGQARQVGNTTTFAGSKRGMVTYDPEISMNFNSKVDKYFQVEQQGDMNGNFKLRQGDLKMLSGRKLSYSDPMLLNTDGPLSDGARLKSSWSQKHSNTCHNLWEYQADHSKYYIAKTLVIYGVQVGNWKH